MKPPQKFYPKKYASNSSPNLCQVHKQQSQDIKKPFQWSFLLPNYWGIWALMAMILPMIWLPLRWQFWLGKNLGILLYHLAKSRRQTTLINLSLAFPKKPAYERELMAKQIFVNQGIGLFESLSAWFRPNLFTRTATISGLQHLITAQNNQQAVLLLGGHYTLLDLGGLLCTQFFPADCVYRPQNNALLEWFIYNQRRKIFGKQIEHKDMRALVNAIQSNHVVWYTPDQDFGLKQGVMSPFFGVPAATITTPRRLAKLGNKDNPPAVMMVHFYRKSPDHLPAGKNPHYHINITPSFSDYPSDDEQADANRVNEALESLIRLAPTQYMWFHRRFKTQSDGTQYYEK